MDDANKLQAFHIMAKPTGPACNLKCTYCFYLEKDALFPKNDKFRMTDEVLKAYIQKTIDASGDSPEVLFAWQGGEPTMMGREFFLQAFALQKKLARGKKITNSIQTNGILLDDSWCEMLSRHNVLVGLSLDGPAHVHNRHRADRAGHPTFDKVFEALKRLQKHKVDYNVLCCVTRESPEEALDVYHFFKESGVEFIQFIPVVERLPDSASQKLGLTLSGPPTRQDVSGSTDSDEADPLVTPWSVSPEGFGQFMCSVFDEWIRHDVEKTIVMNFEWAMNSWLYGDSPACVYSKRCGKAVILEHDGEIYACDHFVYPEYRRGNIVTEDLADILDSVAQGEFGDDKETDLTAYCRECDALFACNGDCPKHRFGYSPDGEAGLSYLCPSYKLYFRHINRFMKALCQLHSNNLPLYHVMDALDGPLIIEKD